MRQHEYRCDDVDRDVWRSIVSDPIRREIIETLRTAERPVSIADLAMQLARRPNGSLDDAEWERAQELRVTLHHRHLPKLDYVGIVEYDFTRETVALAWDAARSNVDRHETTVDSTPPHRER